MNVGKRRSVAFQKHHMSPVGFVAMSSTEGYGFGWSKAYQEQLRCDVLGEPGKQMRLLSL